MRRVNSMLEWKEPQNCFRRIFTQFPRKFLKAERNNAQKAFFHEILLIDYFELMQNSIRIVCFLSLILPIDQ